MNAGGGGERSDERQVWLLRGVIVAVAFVLALVAWIATEDDGPEAQVEGPARVVGEAELAEAAAMLGQPIYWAGPIEGTELELEELEGGGVQVRYVPEGEEVDPAEVLTVGSYPLADPVGALERFAARPGAVVRRAESGVEIFLDEGGPNSVYFADPEGGVQVEVYDPSAEKALGLALSGDVEPVE